MHKPILLVLFVLIICASCKKDKSQTPITALPDIKTGMVAHIPFDGALIDSVSGVIGINNHAVFAADHHGNPNNAMSFHAIDSAFIDFGNLISCSFPSNQFTIACWVMVTDTTNPITIVSKRGITGPYEYSLDNHFGHNHFNLDNWVPDGSNSVYGFDPLKASAAINLNHWQHIAYVADGEALKVYVNGILQSGSDQHTGGLIFSSTSAHFVVGDGGGYGAHYLFNGSIDDIRIYNKVIDAATISYMSNL